MRQPRAQAPKASTAHTDGGRAKPIHRGRQATRLLKLHFALNAAPGGLTLEQLAGAVDEPCSRRTLYRDLEHLQLIGAPLVNKDGVWRVVHPRRSQPPFTVDEALALGLAEELLAPLRHAWLAGPLARARAKVVAGLSPKARALSRDLTQTARAKLPAPALYDDKRAVFDALDEGLQREHVLSIVHTSPGSAPKSREVEPYALWYVAGRAYLIAHCRAAGELRTFAVARIEHAEPLDEAFERDPAFDLEAFAAQSFGVYQGDVWRVELQLAPEVAHLPRERRFHPTQQVTPLPSGGCKLTFEAAGLPEIAAWLAGFGGKVRVLAPPELRDAVRELHRAGLEA